ncbi:hypothetical protein D0N37_15835 [Pseudoalteromonas piscicida]|nr:hypothetical protein D0N37_15835 [Pseudoalteromonas piscicida]
MNLFKTSILSAIASVIKIAVGLVIIKFVAIVSGASGVAFIGHFQNFVNIILLISGNMFKTAVIRHTASCENENELVSYWSSSLKLALIISLITSVIILFNSSSISYFLFNSSEYYYVLEVFSICIPFLY